MKRSFLFILALSIPIFGFSPSCETPKGTESKVTANVGALPPGGGIMMQAVYWDVPSGGTWWNAVSNKVDSWSNAGITALWLPPAQKSQSGGLSMGYNPYDGYNFGQYNQQGSTETRFGSEIELKRLIDTARGKGMQVYADIVINHNSGGAEEYNPYRDDNTHTRFDVRSGKFDRGYNDFHPNSNYSSDEGAFAGFEETDLSHRQTYVHDWLWKRSHSVAKYYKNTMHYDGWRFEYGGLSLLSLELTRVP